MQFNIKKTCPGTLARTGELDLKHGKVRTLSSCLSVPKRQ